MMFLKTDLLREYHAYLDDGRNGGREADKDDDGAVAVLGLIDLVGTGI